MARSSQERSREVRKDAREPGVRRNRDAEILSAAIDVFWRKGYAAASVQDVADAVGLLKGSLYHYIGSKEELLFRIFDDSNRDAAAIVEQVSALDLPPLEKLHTYVSLHIAWHLENIERVGVYFKEIRYLEGEMRNTIAQQRRLYVNFVRELIVTAQAAGELAANIDAKLAARFVLGAANTLADWYRRGGDEGSAVIARRYADMTIAALRGRSRAAVGEATPSLLVG